jgi:glycosyltransferase involved in cell wall biosynthesis
MTDAPKTISILIPVFNEARTLGEILRRVRAADTSGLTREIILVDDASTDGTGDIMKKLTGAKDLKIFSHPHNRGKGAAIRTAIEHAWRHSADSRRRPRIRPSGTRSCSSRFSTAEPMSWPLALPAARIAFLLFWPMASGFLTLLSTCSAISTSPTWKLATKSSAAMRPGHEINLRHDSALSWAARNWRPYRFYEAGISYSAAIIPKARRSAGRDTASPHSGLFSVPIFDQARACWARFEGPALALEE